MAGKTAIPAEELLEELSRRVRRRAGGAASEAAPPSPVGNPGPFGRALRHAVWRVLAPLPRLRAALADFDHRRRGSVVTDGAGRADRASEETAIHLARLRALEDRVDRWRADVEDLIESVRRIERRLEAIERVRAAGDSETLP